MTDRTELMNLFWTSAGIYPGDVEISRFDFRDRVEAASKAGFKGIGLWHTDLDYICKNQSLKEMKAILDDNGIKYVELEFLTDWFLDGGRKWESDNRKRRLLEASEALQAKHIKVGDFYRSYCPMPRIIEAFSSLCAEAANYGATIGFEIMEVSMINNLKDAIHMVETAGAKNGGLIIDIIQQVNLGMTYDDLRTIPVSHLISVELNDGILPGNPGHDMAARKFCGEGEFDIKGFVQCMDGMGFPGPWALEVINKDYAKLPLSEIDERAFKTTMAAFSDSLK